MSTLSSNGLKLTDKLVDIKPHSPIAQLDREACRSRPERFLASDVAPLVGMSSTFIKKVAGTDSLGVDEVICLLDQDSYRETFVRRSQVLDYLLNSANISDAPLVDVTSPDGIKLIRGGVLDVASGLPSKSIQCIVTSTPYWGLRIYEDSFFVSWADGERCPYGHEQTPEGFLRHTTQILHALAPALTDDGSIWWNLMDTFNTRTQIRSNAAEALRAMQGNDGRKWSEHDYRRYSAGHAYLKDGEQCMIPALVAERASRIGYFVKSVITWAKPGTLPEPQKSRVSRSLEYVLHLSRQRTPKFYKAPYRDLAPELGGRNPKFEADKLTDVWSLATSSGGNGHGAQFPLALPARCIALSTDPDDLVLDPFVGSGNSGISARALGRRFVGVDVSDKYLEQASTRILSATVGGKAPRTSHDDASARKYEASRPALSQ